MAVTLNINGEQVTTLRGPLSPLIDLLRDEMQLTGAKAVCREGFCGACTVLVDDIPKVACLLPIKFLEGKQVNTIESFDVNEQLSPLQRAFEEADAVQCGMCFPGMVMSLTGSLHRLSCDSTREEVKALMSGNICRCTGYERIVDAVMDLLNAENGEVRHV
jgi:carbon-monoxide dehydrogenase small subunit